MSRVKDERGEIDIIRLLAGAAKTVASARYCWLATTTENSGTNARPMGGLPRDPNDNEGWGKQNAYYREIDAKGNLSDLQRLGHLDGSVNYPELLYEDPDHVFVVWHENGEEQSRVVMIRGRVNGSASTSGGNHAN